MSEETNYGVIDETEFSFHSPRGIDGDETVSIKGAFEDALEMIQEGAEKVSIGPVKYYGEDGNGYWGEDLDFSRVTIEANDTEWIREEDDDE